MEPNLNMDEKKVKDDRYPPRYLQSLNPFFNDGQGSRPKKDLGHHQTSLLNMLLL